MKGWLQDIGVKKPDLFPMTDIPISLSLSHDPSQLRLDRGGRVCPPLPNLEMKKKKKSLRSEKKLRGGPGERGGGRVPERGAGEGRRRA